MALSVSIELVSSLARVTSVKSTKGVLVSDGHPDTKIGPGHLGPIKKILKTDEDNFVPFAMFVVMISKNQNQDTELKQNSKKSSCAFWK